jgi:hypothetical protein
MGTNRQLIPHANQPKNYQPPLDLVLHMMNVKMNFDEAKLSDTGMHGNLSKKKLNFLVFLGDVVRFFKRQTSYASAS